MKLRFKAGPRGEHTIKEEILCIARGIRDSFNKSVWEFYSRQTRVWALQREVDSLLENLIEAQQKAAELGERLVQATGIPASAREPAGTELATTVEQMLATRDFRDERPDMHRSLADALRSYYRDPNQYTLLLHRAEETKKQWRW